MTSHDDQFDGARVGVVTFPGSLDDRDAMRAVGMTGAEPVALWHDDPDLRGVDAVVLPGGFSYGDYLRAGSIARFATVMASVAAAARHGLPVLGICNGFQILCEAGLLPGALVRNRHLHFRNRDQWLRVDNAATVWTGGYTAGQHALIPIKHAEGCYVADTRTLDELEAEGRVVFRYASGDAPGSGRGSTGNPNGSQHDIAGVCNADGNVVGLMPHPEHAVEPLTGPSTDGLTMFTSVLAHLGQQTTAAVAR